VWVCLICGFAILHAVHLSADFPITHPGSMTGQNTPMKVGTETQRFARICSATFIWQAISIRRCAASVPFLEWLLFFFTGVSVDAARGLAVALFFATWPELPSVAHERDSLEGCLR